MPYTRYEKKIIKQNIKKDDYKNEDDTCGTVKCCHIIGCCYTCKKPFIWSLDEPLSTLALKYFKKNQSEKVRLNNYCDENGIGRYF